MRRNLTDLRPQTSDLSGPGSDVRVVQGLFTGVLEHWRHCGSPGRCGTNSLLPLKGQLDLTVDYTTKGYCI